MDILNTLGMNAQSCGVILVELIKYRIERDTRRRGNFFKERFCNGLMIGYYGSTHIRTNSLGTKMLSEDSKKELHQRA